MKPQKKHTERNINDQEQAAPETTKGHKWKCITDEKSDGETSKTLGC